ncbi:hypothetical protein DH2020_044893 [Rehmannia glutinosa]|uniref:Magnesium transporter n=1 Tax=Rehmannia glutinosa TaxID=99300 RepID=A0ABR0UGF7_REHGL
MGKLTFRRRKKAVPPPMPPPPPSIEASTTSKTTVKKKAGGARLWMRMDRLGQSELIECDKSVIIKRVSIPARDLRILGPIFSHSSSILAREKAMIVNLEFIRAIVTAEEVLLLDPLRQEVLPFVDQLRRQLPQKALLTAEGVQDELPFEFQVLEMALEVVCTYLDSNVAELERDAYPALDELAISVSTKNLEHVRSLKSNLTRLLARVQKVRDEIEHLLDDNEDMAQLYLTRKWIQNQQAEAMSTAHASNSIVPAAAHLRRLSSTRSGSLVSNYLNDDDVEDLEMLLEAYFMQLDGTRNKILSIIKFLGTEYIDDTEDYVNIQLDNQRNELIQLQLTMTIASLAIAVETLLAGIFAACVVLFILVLAYARWKKLLGS